MQNGFFEFYDLIKLDKFCHSKILQVHKLISYDTPSSFEKYTVSRDCYAFIWESVYSRPQGFFCLPLWNIVSVLTIVSISSRVSPSV